MSAIGEWLKMQEPPERHLYSVGCLHVNGTMHLAHRNLEYRAATKLAGGVCEDEGLVRKSEKKLAFVYDYVMHIHYPSDTRGM